jgi:type III secretory pathway component EscU
MKGVFMLALRVMLWGVVLVMFIVVGLVSIVFAEGTEEQELKMLSLEVQNYTLQSQNLELQCKQGFEFLQKQRPEIEEKAKRAEELKKKLAKP